MNNTSSTIKVSISISKELHSKLLIQSRELDVTINTLLKQSAVAKINSLELDFFTSEQRLALKTFTGYQIRLSQTMQTISDQANKQGKSIPIDKIIEMLRNFNDDFKTLIAQLSKSKS